MSLSSLFYKFSKKNKANAKVAANSPLMQEQRKISPYLQDNLNWLKSALGHTPDLITKDITIGQNNTLKVVFLEALVSNEIISNQLYGMMVDSNFLYEGQEDLFNFVKEKTLNSGQVKEITTLGEALEAVIFGESVVFFAGYAKALVIETKSWESRSIEESKIETTLRGPRDSFNENIMTNLALIRRRLRDPNLRIHRLVLGERSNTPILILYLEDVANPEIFNELLARLNKIKIDGVLESGVIEQLIEDNIYSPFPQVLYSERPDKAVAHLLEGRFVILTDGTPFALIVPVTISEFISSPEDKYERWIMASLIRLLRYISVFMAMFLPGIYISLITYHYHLIPFRLIIPIAESRVVVPFSPFLEAIIMEITLEFLREAAIRLPNTVAQTIGVVGGIIVGNAAVQAGLFSSLMVIVVAVTAISTFVIPNYNFGLAVRFVRFPVAVISAVFGGFGLILAWMLLTIHLATLESFGVPYGAPFAPLKLPDLKNTIIRLPLSSILTRDKTARNENPKRQVAKGEN